MVFKKKSVVEKKRKISEAQKLRHEKNREKKSRIQGELVPIGRRVCELALLAQTMWCDNCDIALSFRFIEEERQHGLASNFKIRCHKCLSTYDVPTSSVIPDSCGSGRSLYAVNCKFALGCIDTGVGHHQLNKLLSAANLPVINPKTMKLAEDRVGPAVVETADVSCKEAIIEERRLSVLNSSNTEEPMDLDRSPPPSPARNVCQETPSLRRLSTTSSDVVDIVVRYDFGWDKRGNGFVYNSHSGRGSVIGNNSEKILAYKVMSTYCNMCARGLKIENHVCVKNHTGSAKSMEPKAAVDLCLKNADMDEAGVRVTGFVGDKDSSTIAALRRESQHPIQKFLDRNHNIKSVNNHLYRLKKEKHRFLTKPVIEYLKRCIGYAIMANVGDEEEVRKAVLNVADHIYGQHSACNEAWCQGKHEINYKFKHLPDGKPLSDAVFRADLEEILKEQAGQAKQLAHGGSTQLNENFNHMCNARAPKSRHYAGTASLQRRVAAAVCCKNYGAEHLERTFRVAGLSPSLSAHRKTLQKKSEYLSAYQKDPRIKKRRLFRKMKDTWKDAATGAAEGLTYSSGMGNTMERAADASRISSWLPGPTPLRDDCRTVIVDLETTGFKNTDEVVQIAAKCGDKQFNAFMVPTVSFHPEASKVTGMTVVEGSLFRGDELLITTPPEQAVQQFLNFLKECSEQVILVGHNFLRFDGPRLMKLFTVHNLAKELTSMTYGLTDTLPLISQGKIKKQALLAELYLKGSQWKEFTAHDALSDCCILEGLLQHFEVQDADLIRAVLPIRDFMENCAANKRARLNRPKLASMKEFGVSTGMIGKMAREGVTIEELVSEYQKHGRKGLEVCLGVQLGGKPRVTTAKKVVDKIESFVQSRVP